MKFRILLKTSLMLGLVVVGRLARDVEHTNPGRSLHQIIQIEAAARTAPARVVRVVPVSRKASATPARRVSTQAASLSSMGDLD